MPTKNHRGVTQYPKADARRLFVLLAAIDTLARPTIMTLSDYTGHNKGTVDRDVAKLNTQYGVQIVKAGAVFSIESWGSLLHRTQVLTFLPSSAR